MKVEKEMGRDNSLGRQLLREKIGREWREQNVGWKGVAETWRSAGPGGGVER